MSYTPTNWKAGDTVTSAKLNKLEQGVAASGTKITFVELIAEEFSNIPKRTSEAVQREIRLNKTWQEIYDAAQEGIVYVKQSFNISEEKLVEFSPILVVTNVTGEGYLIITMKYNLSDMEFFPLMYYSESPDDYPIQANPNSEVT